MKSIYSIDKKRTIRLVSYSSDSSEDTTPDKKLKLSPSKHLIPPSIRRMFEDRQVPEDTTGCEGRVRSFSHVRGNWASYVYVQLGSGEILQEVTKIILKEFGDSEINFRSFEQFHISLSRTVTVPYHWIQPILSSLRGLADRTHPFSVSFSGLKLLANEEKTRTFLVLEVELGEDTLTTLVGGVDGILSEYKLPSFYRPLSLHSSVLWTLSGTTETTESAVNKLWHSKVAEVLNGVEFEVESLKFKTGHKTYNLNFNK